MDKEELLNCPFCGSKGIEEGFYTRCSNINCIMTWHPIRTSSWNRRQQSASGQVKEVSVEEILDTIISFEDGRIEVGNFVHKSDFNKLAVAIHSLIYGGK